MSNQDVEDAPPTTQTTQSLEKVEIIHLTHPILDPPKDCEPVPSHILSQEQKEKLEALRSHLPKLLASVDEDKTLHSKEAAWCNDPCLMRYLRATKWDLEHAKTKLSKSLVWRRDAKPDELPLDEIAIESKTGKLTLNGFDKRGSPVLMARPRHENTKPSDNQIRNVVFNLERAIRIMPSDVETITILIDFNGAIHSTSPGIGIAKKFLDVLGSHYPERLGCALCVNTPWFFYPFFRIIQPFIDPVTRAKIKFVDLSPVKPRRDHEWVDIKDYIHPDQLHEEFGGRVRYDFEFDSYWKYLLEKSGTPF